MFLNDTRSIILRFVTLEISNAIVELFSQESSNSIEEKWATRTQQPTVEMHVADAEVQFSPKSNYGVTCEDEAKRRNSGTKTKTFEENCYLLLYAVSSKEDTAYQRQLITRIRVIINSRSGVSLFTYTPYAQLVISQRYEVNVIDGN
ncbi:hypothetical protein Tco_1522980 [Tanacetum coccineum]